MKAGRNTSRVARRLSGRVPCRWTSCTRRVVCVRAVVEREVAVGIDLGTTNSCVAALHETTGEPFIIPLPPRNAKTMPSVVAYGDNGVVRVGEAALNRPNSFHSVKRFIGRSVDASKARKKKGAAAASAAATAEHLPTNVARDSAWLVRNDVAASQVAYDVLVEEDSDGLVVANAADERGYTPPEEVSAHVLRALLDAAEAVLQERENAIAESEEVEPEAIRITRAVIGVPAYFDRAQRAATLDAASMAGITGCKLLREPLAAALAFEVRSSASRRRLREQARRKARRAVSSQEDDDDEEEDFDDYDDDDDPLFTDGASVLVFDLGGGTFDVSVLDVGGGTVEVRSTGGDSQLGGDDLDASLCKLLWPKYVSRGLGTGALTQAAQAVKVALSDADEVDVAAAVEKALGPGAPAPAMARLHRADAEVAWEPCFRRMAKPLELACAQAHIDLEKARRAQEESKKRRRNQESLPPVDEVILVGGATKAPSVRAFVEASMGVSPRSTVNPDEAVALGCAVHAAYLSAGDDEVEDDAVVAVEHWQGALLRALARDL
ncbi:chaperone protein DnaK [Pseudoscourfieldia marina]